MYEEPSLTEKSSARVFSPTISCASLESISSKDFSVIAGKNTYNERTLTLSKNSFNPSSLRRENTEMFLNALRSFSSTLSRFTPDLTKKSAMLNPYSFSSLAKSYLEGSACAAFNKASICSIEASFKEPSSKSSPVATSTGLTFL